MRCGFRQMQFTRPIFGSAKTEFRDLLESTLLLNRKELEDVFYMKMERLDDTYPMEYQFHRSDERIKKYVKTFAAQTRAAHRFPNSFKAVKNLGKCSTCR